MINIFRLFRDKTSDKTVKGNAGEAPVERSGINQRLADIYGQEMLQLQTLYEKQVVRDTWLLRDEAIWLLSGIDPEQRNEADAETRQHVGDLWEHARKCVDERLLAVVNREQKAEQWEVRPVDIYQWARISRVELPDVFSSLMEFVVNTIKPAGAESATASNNDGPDNTVHQFDQDREAVLGMALAVLAAYPERCKSSSGRIKAQRIVEIINEKEQFWLGDRQTTMSLTAKHDLISKWLATIPL